MLSDHGTNFVAAEREFRQLGEALNPKKKQKQKNSQQQPKESYGTSILH